MGPRVWRQGGHRLARHAPLPPRPAPRQAPRFPHRPLGPRFLTHLNKRVVRSKRGSPSRGKRSMGRTSPGAKDGPGFGALCAAGWWGTPVGRLRSMNGTFWSTSNARAPLAGPGAGRPWGRLPSPCCCPFQVSTPGLGRGGFSCKRQTLSARSHHRRPRKGRPSTPHAVREPPRWCPGSGGSRDAAGGSASDAGAEDVHRGPCPTRGPRRGRRAPEVQGEDRRRTVFAAGGRLGPAAASRAIDLAGRPGLRGRQSAQSRPAGSVSLAIRRAKLPTPANSHLPGSHRTCFSNARGTRSSCWGHTH